jgi:hypothetical protein
MYFSDHIAEKHVWHENVVVTRKIINNCRGFVDLATAHPVLLNHVAKASTQSILLMYLEVSNTSSTEFCTPPLLDFPAPWDAYLGSVSCLNCSSALCRVSTHVGHPSDVDTGDMHRSGLHIASAGHVCDTAVCGAVRRRWERHACRVHACVLCSGRALAFCLSPFHQGTYRRSQKPVYAPKVNSTLTSKPSPEVPITLLQLHTCWSLACTGATP